MTTEPQTLEQFKEWFCREVPPGTVIGNPEWWVPRIARAILSDPAIPAHVPAYAELQAEIQCEERRLEAAHELVSGLDALCAELQAENERLQEWKDASMHPDPSKWPQVQPFIQRIADLESQLAEANEKLAGGGEAVCEIKRNGAGQVYIDWMNNGNGSIDAMLKLIGHKLYTTPQASASAAVVPEEKRLRWLYDSQMSKFIAPIVTFEKWLASIDDALLSTTTQEG